MIEDRSCSHRDINKSVNMGCITRKSSLSILNPTYNLEECGQWHEPSITLEVKTLGIDISVQAELNHK